MAESSASESPAPALLKVETEHIAKLDALLAPVRGTTPSPEDAKRIREADRSRSQQPNGPLCRAQSRDHRSRRKKARRVGAVAGGLWRACGVSRIPQRQSALAGPLHDGPAHGRSAVYARRQRSVDQGIFQGYATGDGHRLCRPRLRASGRRQHGGSQKIRRQSVARPTDARHAGNRISAPLSASVGRKRSQVALRPHGDRRRSLGWKPQRTRRVCTSRHSVAVEPRAEKSHGAPGRLQQVRQRHGT